MMPPPTLKHRANVLVFVTPKGEGEGRGREGGRGEREGGREDGKGEVEEKIYSKR